MDGLNPTRDYKERIAYDPNGNITKYLRNSNNNAGTEHAMDSLNYFYNTATNQLNHIKDNAEDWIGGGHDLQDQSSNNYGYDPSGNMTKDLSQSIPDGGISWNAYGKILKVYHSTTTDNNPVKQVTYGYDAGGNRISKRVVKTGTNTVNWTWYVRDASGNLMGTYISNGDSTHALTDYDLRKQDQVIYGSSRIGVAGTAYGVKKDSYDEFYYSPWNGVHLWVYKGGDQYELTNHLGNVLVTVGDRKIGMPSAANSSLIDHWKADISSAADYYPFGMVMADRTYQNNYRYGFNGQEKSDEIAGNWNHNTAEFWEYDTRSGRRWNLDPKRTVGVSEYSAFNDNPVWVADPLGDTSIQTPGGGMMDIGDKKFETFSGSKQKIGSKIIQPARGTLKSFTVTGEAIDSKSARFVAMFDKESGEFTGYAWDKQPTYTYEDLINDERAGAADQYAHGNDPTYQYYNSSKDAQKSFINLGLSVVLPSPVFKTGTAAANSSLSLGNLKVPVYRVYGDGASMYGRSYSLINPKYVPFYRNLAGLPAVNSGEYLLKGSIQLRDLKIGRWIAAPLDGNSGGLPFELYQNYNQLRNPVNVIIRKPF